MKSFWKSLVEWLRDLCAEKQTWPPPPPGKADGPSGAKVYHEIFLADEPTADGRWLWSARVYGASQQGPMEANSSHISYEQAYKAAMAWCESAKERMRGLQ